MKKIILLFFLLLSSIKILAQDSIIASISYSNCNMAFASFIYQSDSAYDELCWYFGDGVHSCSSWSSDVWHFYNTPGNYTLTLNIIRNGDTTTIIKPDLIKIHHPPVVNFTYSTSDTMAFAPLTTTFQNTTVPGDGDTLNYLWVFGDGDSSQTENSVHTFVHPNTYITSLKVSDNVGCDVTNDQYIIVKDTAQLGEIDYIISACDNGVSPCGYIKHYSLYQNTTKVYGYIYENCCGTKTVTIRISHDTIHIRKFIVGPLCTCGCGFCFAIDVPNITLDSVYVDFDNDVVLVKKGCYGINESKTSDGFDLFPNPAIESIIVETSLLPKEAAIFVYNMQGQLLLQKAVKQSKTIFDIATLAKGVYFIKVTSEEGCVVRKFLKE
jgi:hypothetical protein